MDFSSRRANSRKIKKKAGVFHGKKWRKYIFKKRWKIRGKIYKPHFKTKFVL